MKSMVLTGISAMEVRDVPMPKLKGGQDVLIKITTVGVCGSDIHYYKTGRIGSQVVRYPFTVGHECAGIVEETGSNVSCLKKGDRVAVDPAMWCNKCDQCLTGRHHTCRNLRFLGCPGQAEGALSEYLVMPEQSLFPLNDNLTMEQAALSEPLSIGIYAVRLAENVKNKHIAILGSGPIGLSVLKAAVAEGAAAVYVTDKIDERKIMAVNSGAIWTGNPDEEDVVANIIQQEPKQLDIVFECCGQQDALNQGVELLKPGGELMIVGIPEVDKIYFTPDAVRRKEITIRNVRRQVNCVQPALDMIYDNKIVVDDMVTHRFSFEQTPEAFDLVGEYRDGVMKAMINLI